MTPERWQQIKAVINVVRAAPPSMRADVLRKECGNDSELLAEVESLLVLVPGDDDTHDSLDNAVAAESHTLQVERRSRDADRLLAELRANLAHSYEVISAIGAGGMGTVFLARELSLDRKVAIKVLRPEQAMTPGARERFQREARIAAQLSHPGILPLYAFGEVGGMWYLVMGYARGTTLAQRLHTDGRLTPDEAWRILSALASALEHAHDRNVIHRDIKPANILIDAENENPLLADFGISKAIGVHDTITRAGDVLGTPHYMAPEQIADSSSANAQSDIYSLGAVAYAMLTGKSPLSEISTGDLIADRLRWKVEPLDQLNPSIPKRFATVISRCLAVRPEDRWSSAREFREALERADPRDVDGKLRAGTRDVSGIGAYALAWFTFWLVIAAGVRSTGARVLLVLIALTIPIDLGLHVARIATRSDRRRQVLRVAFWPPIWWSMWWPSSLRRPDDVWSRLPMPARLVRIVLSAAFQHIGILSLEFHVDKLSRPLL